MSKTRVLLADDQILFVESLKIVIDSSANDMQVVGIVHDGKEVLDFVHRCKTDMILMDVRMPNIDGVEATKIVHQKYADIKIVMLTNFDEDEYVKHAMEFGAVGYLLKDMPPSELVSSLRAVRDGAVLMSPSVTDRLFRNEENPDWLDALTKKEKDILCLISKGYRNREIGENLNLGEQTVKNYISSIYTKMGIDSRFKAIRMAIEAKLDRVD